MSRWALVTGASGDIGQAIAGRLCSDGYNVVGTYLTNGGWLKAVSKEMRERLIAYKLDVTSVVEVFLMMEFIKMELEPFSVIVNNAGINKPTQFDEIETIDWHKIMNVNLYGPFLIMREFIRQKQLKEGARIINIASVSGQYGGPKTAHYAASKAGLISLTQVVARNYPQFRVNAVSPGIIASGMAESAVGEKGIPNIKDQIILQRMGSVYDVAGAVSWLVSPDGEYVTGQTINVNGGLYF